MQVLNGVLSATDVPFSSYVAHPRTPLHFVDARLKQLWLVALLPLIPRLPWQAQLAIVGCACSLHLSSIWTPVENDDAAPSKTVHVPCAAACGCLRLARRLGAHLNHMF